MDTNEQLILRADPVTKMVVQSKTTVSELNLFQLHELVTQPWFQDNTLLFDILLNDRLDFVMCVFPPGSGKSTNAKLLRYYLGKNGMSNEIRVFLDTCKFQKIENTRVKNDTSYVQFRSSSDFVLFMDFNQVEGDDRETLEITYGKYMLHCWENCGLPDNMVKNERDNLKKNPHSVWSSLLRLRYEISHYFKTKVYVILDSLDNMYNIIATLPVTDSSKLYKLFTKGIAKIVIPDETTIKTFCFGVSPYLYTEFQTFNISYHFIGSKTTEVGKYFSYSDTKIQDFIATIDSKWNISVDSCKTVSLFQYGSNSFVNPYLCISYLRSLHGNGATFSVNVSPRSLWMKCIFEEDDWKILCEVLSGKSNRDFNMSVSMFTMCTISEDSTDRQLYYPLFIYGGFLSCNEEEDGTYTLFAANQSVEVILNHHLSVLHYRKFEIPISQCKSIFNKYLTGSFSEFCTDVSACLRTMSSHLIQEERPYHTFMVGIIAPLLLSGYDIDHDKEYGLVKPDTFIQKGDRIIILEYKHVIPPSYIPKKARAAVGNKKGAALRAALKKFYALLESISKSKIVNMCRPVVSTARLCQIPKYAADFALHFKKDVETSLMIFYVNHVIILNSKYSFKTCTFTDYEIFASRGYFDTQDLEKIKSAR